MKFSALRLSRYYLSRRLVILLLTIILGTLTIGTLYAMHQRKLQPVALSTKHANTTKAVTGDTTSSAKSEAKVATPPTKRQAPSTQPSIAPNQSVNTRTKPAANTSQGMTSQGMQCPFAETPSGGTVPSGIYGPRGTSIEKNSTSPPIEISSANSSIKATWTIINPAKSPVYAAALSSGAATSTFTFHIVAQSSVAVGHVYWVYINIRYTDGTTAQYSLPVEGACY